MIGYITQDRGDFPMARYRSHSQYGMAVYHEKDFGVDLMVSGLY